MLCFRLPYADQKLWRVSLYKFLYWTGLKYSSFDFLSAVSKQFFACCGQKKVVSPHYAGYHLLWEAYRNALAVKFLEPIDVTTNHTATWAINFVSISTHFLKLYRLSGSFFLPFHSSPRSPSPPLTPPETRFIKIVLWTCSRAIWKSGLALAQKKELDKILNSQKVNRGPAGLYGGMKKMLRRLHFWSV